MSSFSSFLLLEPSGIPATSIASEAAMKFYTAEMVNRWNEDVQGTNKDVYDREWEEAQDAYDKHIQSITDDLSYSVRKFTDAVLHDETLISVPKVNNFGAGDEFTVVTVSKRDGLLHVVTWVLDEIPKLKFNDGKGFDLKDRMGVWLYDEVGINGEGKYTHNVLFSNGMELAVVFRDMHWYECLVQEEG
jgi:hypothetical protein